VNWLSNFFFTCSKIKKFFFVNLRLQKFVPVAGSGIKVRIRDSGLTPRIRNTNLGHTEKINGRAAEGSIYVKK
jgi:hypothetical protein